MMKTDQRQALAALTKARLRELAEAFDLDGRRRPRPPRPPPSPARRLTSRPSSGKPPTSCATTWTPPWRGDGAAAYEDVPGFAKSATTEEVREHHFVLTPGRYVGAEAVEDDGEPFAEGPKHIAWGCSREAARAPGSAVPKSPGTQGRSAKSSLVPKPRSGKL